MSNHEPTNTQRVAAIRAIRADGGFTLAAAVRAMNAAFGEHPAHYIPYVLDAVRDSGRSAHAISESTGVSPIVLSVAILHNVRADELQAAVEEYANERDRQAEPAVCAGTGNHDGQSVSSCDECDPELSVSA